MAKKLFIKTYGCQMNVYDSDRMVDVLAPLGYQRCEHVGDANMIIINTCHIREKASEKVFSELGRLRKAKEAKRAQGQDLTITVAGCVAQAEGEEISRRAPWVDVVVGPQAYHRLPELVAKADPASRNAVIDTDFPVEDKFDSLPEEHAPRGASAFLSIQEGCDKFCSFCVVPYTRGAEFSRPAASIIAEAKNLIKSGSVEITLLGQNVNAWHGDAPDSGKWSFAQLLRAIADLKGLERLRYTTSHPCDMDDALIKAHGELPQLMPHLHLPVQSGSDSVLRAMNRRHSRDDYLRIIERLREARSDIALSSDFIVGFPGESDRDFAETISLIAQVEYASAYSFKYSPRPGTPAANTEEQIEDKIKAERLASLQQLTASQQLAFNKSKIGAVMEVLIENAANKQEQKSGRSPWMQAVYFPHYVGEIGAIVPLRVTDAYQNSLTATPLEERRSA